MGTTDDGLDATSRRLLNEIDNTQEARAREASHRPKQLRNSTSSHSKARTAARHVFDSGGLSRPTRATRKARSEMSATSSTPATGPRGAGTRAPIYRPCQTALRCPHIECLGCRSNRLAIRLVKTGGLGRKGEDLVGIFSGLELALCLAPSDKRLCHLRHRASLPIVTDRGTGHSQFKHVEFGCQEGGARAATGGLDARGPPLGSDRRRSPPSQSDERIPAEGLIPEQSSSINLPRITRNTRQRWDHPHHRQATGPTVAIASV